MAAFLVKPDYGPVMEVREDKEEPQDQEMDLANMRAVWLRENPDTCQVAGLIIVEEPAK